MDFRGHISLYIHILVDNFRKMLKILLLSPLIFPENFQRYSGAFYKIFPLFPRIVLISYIGKWSKFRFKLQGLIFHNRGILGFLFPIYSLFYFSLHIYEQTIQKLSKTGGTWSFVFFLTETPVKEHILLQVSPTSRQNSACDPLPSPKSVCAHLLVNIFKWSQPIAKICMWRPSSKPECALFQKYE